MTSTHNDPAPDRDPTPEDPAPTEHPTPTEDSGAAVRPLTSAPTGRTTAKDQRHDATGRHHRDAVGERLDSYLGAVVRDLNARGVLTGAPQRTDPEHRLIGSIVLDCTTLRIAAWRPSQHGPSARQSLGDAIHPQRPTPVIATWDEHHGWCVGLHHDPTHSSRRYLHLQLLPPAHVVADFVVGLALGELLGARHPLPPPLTGTPQLRLVP